MQGRKIPFMIFYFSPQFTKLKVKPKARCKSPLCCRTSKFHKDRKSPYLSPILRQTKIENKASCSFFPSPCQFSKQIAINQSKVDIKEVSSLPPPQDNTNTSYLTQNSMQENKPSHACTECNHNHSFPTKLTPRNSCN
ncbi:hypothetical protein E2542_SST26860 [Spatholobus suberectus]|nr:hypothetical protein E2542_SST26860 [Spatholobus suberectus]